MNIERRSGCPINLTMEVLGDRWSLVVIRDMMFGNRRHFRDILTHSMEGIATNILAARLQRLTELGLISRVGDPSHKQKGIYSLTEMAIQLAPVLAQIGAWGIRHMPVSNELSIRARILEEGGPALWKDFMDELRFIHLAPPDQLSARMNARPGPDSVVARLQAAYEAEAAKAGAALSNAPSQLV
jgi:DNA-binding HxlR family transcriptional regulator